MVGAPSTELFPHLSGVVRGLTILVDFSDQSGDNSKAEIDAWLNTRGYNECGLTGPIRDYFLKQSNDRGALARGLIALVLGVSRRRPG